MKNLAYMELRNCTMGIGINPANHENCEVVAGNIEAHQSRAKYTIVDNR
jgi:Tfp pilus assembly protein PilZ